MIEVNEFMQEFFMNENSEKKLVVKIDDKTLTHQQIISESFELTESICDNDNLEFVGCNASQMKLTVVNVNDEIDGLPITVSVTVTGQTPIKLFHGYIDSAKRQSNKKRKDIVAYDSMYYLANLDATDFFNGRTFPMTLGTFRNQFFAWASITQKSDTFNLDSYVITNPKEFVEKNIDENITALQIAKSICQLLGKFGIINRNNKFEYRELAKKTESSTSVPSKTLTLPFILMGKKSIFPDSTYFPTYRSVNYESKKVWHIKEVEVKQQADSTVRGFYQTNGYRYSVMGNLLTRYDDESGLDDVARNIWEQTYDSEYLPFTSVNIGLPYVEVGDSVEFYVYDFEKSEAQEKDVFTLKQFVILKRTLKGIKSMTDAYSAKGNLTNDGFKSDLGFKIKEEKVLEKQVTKNTSDIEDLQDTQLKVESVASLPASPDANTIYLIQGTVG